MVYTRCTYVQQRQIFILYLHVHVHVTTSPHHSSTQESKHYVYVFNSFFIFTASKTCFELKSSFFFSFQTDFVSYYCFFLFVDVDADIFHILIYYHCSEMYIADIPIWTSTMTMTVTSIFFADADIFHILICYHCSEKYIEDIPISMTTMMI